MDAFSAQFDRVRQQLAGLTASQRMLVGTLVAVMALTVLYWGKYAAAPDLVAVLDQPLSDEEIAPIVHRLEVAGVAHSVVAGKVLVPADRKPEILADLMYAQELPRDTHSAFEEMTAKELNPFSSQTERDAVYNHATELELANIIRRWPGVADARVVINSKNERHIEGSIPPTATVAIATRGGDMSHAKQLVQAAADGVAGAVSGLTQQNIRVIVNGASIRATPNAGPDGGAGGTVAASDAMELQEKGEAAFEQKIHNLFRFIPEMTVTVTCDVDTSSRRETVTKYDKGNTVSLPVAERTQNEQHTTTGDGGREPGAATNDGTANVGQADAAGGGAVSGPVTTGTTSDEQTNTENFVPNSRAEITTPGGKVTIRSASVCVPMSYVARRFKSANPAAKDPTAADLLQAAAAETARLRDQVAKVVGLPTTENVSVDTFADDAGLTTTADLALAVSPAGSPSGLGGIAVHGKEIAVGVLAVVSLAMMFQMARKGGVPLPPLSPAPSLAGLGGASVAYGGGGGGDEDDGDDDQQPARPVKSTSTLVGGIEGMELDPDMVRTQQMLDQVSTLVKEDPDAAAALVKRWVSRV